MTATARRRAVRRAAVRALEESRRRAPAVDARDQRIRELGQKLRLAVRAKYDAAQTSVDNRNHWGAADGLSANAANSAEVRRTLRNRARYEVANNSYASGIVQTIANDLVGTGPRLRASSPSDADNATVEALFGEWADAVDLAGKLRTARMAKVQDGEAFGVLVTNPRVRAPVKLDVRLIEAEQVASPFVGAVELPVDGIKLDRFGNPLAYQVLKEHPGELRIGSLMAFDELPADAVLHYFTCMRPGQARGVPEITPALELFGQLRRYTLATLAAAEVAADFALVVQSSGPPSDDAAVAPETMEAIELEKRMATFLPEGWQLGQAKPEQPTTTYGDFKGEILNEIARCLSIPFNVAAGNSSKYNYASGRLDWQTYWKALDVERARVRRAMLDRIFAAWLDEAALIEGFLPQPFRMARAVPHQWHWDGQEHVDPQREAAAQEVRLRNHTTTLAEEYGRRGKDWQVALRQIAAERRLMAELGLEPSEATPAAPPPAEDEDEGAPEPAPAEQDDEA